VREWSRVKKSLEKRTKQGPVPDPYPYLKMCSDDVGETISYTLGACGGVSFSLNASGMEIVAAVVTLDNLTQFKFSYVHFV
jgi:hypothetical protein